MEQNQKYSGTNESPSKLDLGPCLVDRDRQSPRELEIGGAASPKENYSSYYSFTDTEYQDKSPPGFRAGSEGNSLPAEKCSRDRGMEWFKYPITATGDEILSRCLFNVDKDSGLLVVTEFNDRSRSGSSCYHLELGDRLVSANGSAVSSVRAMVDFLEKHEKLPIEFVFAKLQSRTALQVNVHQSSATGEFDNSTDSGSVAYAAGYDEQLLTDSDNDNYEDLQPEGTYTKCSGRKYPGLILPDVEDLDGLRRESGFSSDEGKSGEPDPENYVYTYNPVGRTRSLFTVSRNSARDFEVDSDQFRTANEQTFFGSNKSSLRNAREAFLS